MASADQHLSEAIEQHQRARELDAQLEDTLHARDESIRKALDQGATIADISALTLISKPRLYQIRDKRR